MMKLLKSPWILSVIGLVLYLLITMAVLQTRQKVEPVSHSGGSIAPLTAGLDWNFHNPEIDQIITELREEKKALAVRQAQLSELETRLHTERQELNQALTNLLQMRKDFDRVFIQVRAEEVANLKKLAKTYAAMNPDAASKVLQQLDDEMVVKIMVFMKETETAPIFESISKGGEVDAKRVAALSERLRLALAVPAATPPPAP